MAAPAIDPQYYGTGTHNQSNPSNGGSDKSQYDEKDPKYTPKGEVYEAAVVEGGAFVASDGHLKRQLKNRHVAMISIGGVIGTGLFLGTGESLQNGGPIGLLLGYMVMGTVCYSVMICLGEMVAFLPTAGGHIRLAERFVDRSLSFTTGWNYWYSWTITLPAELSAAATLMHFWVKPKFDAAWICMCLVIVILINLLGAGAYGEAEFIFASIKVITITGLIILGIVLDLGGGPNHDRIGFRYWKNPGPFVNFSGIAGSKGHFLGWWSVMTQAGFSYLGTEIVAIAAGEAKNPRKNIPKAIKRVYIRICLFYFLGVTVIGLLVPSNELALSNGLPGTAAASPFVIAITNAGIKGLPSVINAALLTSAWSAASSDLYTSSRAIYGMSLTGNAPKIFSRTTGHGLPYVAVISSSLFAFLSFMALSSGSSKVFLWLQNITSISGLMTWFSIVFTYTRFNKGLKAQGYDRKKMPYYNFLAPYAAWYAIGATLTVSFFSGFAVFLKGGWNTATFITNYISFILYFIFWIGSKLYYREPMKKAHEMDFVSGLAEIEAATYDDPPPTNWWEKLWAWLM